MRVCTTRTSTADCRIGSDDAHLYAAPLQPHPGRTHHNAWFDREERTQHTRQWSGISCAPKSTTPCTVATTHLCHEGWMSRSRGPVRSASKCQLTETHLRWKRPVPVLRQGKTLKGQNGVTAICTCLVGREEERSRLDPLATSTALTRKPDSRNDRGTCWLQAWHAANQG